MATPFQRIGHQIEPSRAHRACPVRPQPRFGIEHQKVADDLFCRVQKHGFQNRIRLGRRQNDGHIGKRSRRQKRWRGGQKRGGRGNGFIAVDKGKGHPFRTCPPRPGSYPLARIQGQSGGRAQTAICANRNGRNSPSNFHCNFHCGFLHGEPYLRPTRQTGRPGKAAGQSAAAGPVAQARPQAQPDRTARAFPGRAARQR